MNITEKAKEYSQRYVCHGYRPVSEESFIAGAEWMLERAIEQMKVLGFDYSWYDEVKGDCDLIKEFEDSLRNGNDYEMH